MFTSDYSQRPKESLFQTGFGNVSAHILSYLHSKGHTIYEMGVGWVGQHTQKPPWEIFSPTAYGRPEGQDGVPIVAMALGVDAAINLMDVPDWSYLGNPIDYRDRRTGQGLKQEVINAIEARQWKALALTVIDGACPNETLPKDWEAAFRGMDGVAVASKWAQDLVKKAYNINVAYHPHGIDLNFFRQYPQDEARKRFRLPQDKFIILVCGVNRARKMLPASFEAVAKFADLTGRKDILFWVHSHPAPTGIGHDLQGLADAYGMKARGIEVIHTTRIPEAALPWMYATASTNGMVLHLSGGEGFGCVILEAAACRAPVLATDYCLDPSTKILKSDLTWVDASHLVVGDELIGFDEEISDHSPRGCAGRHFQRATIDSLSTIPQPCFEIETNLGTVIASDRHRWLTNNGWNGGKRAVWKETQSLVQGDRIYFFASPWTMDTSYEGGCISGLLDGEGWVRNNELGFAQKPGELLDEVQSYLRSHAIEFSDRVNVASNVHSLTVRCRFDSLKVLGMLRPKRLINKVTWDGKRIWNKISRFGVVAAIRPLGIRETIGIQTSTGTLIAGGFFSHNSGQAELVPTDFQKIPVKALIPFPSTNISWAWPDTDVAAERMAQLSSDKGLRTSIKRSGWEHATKYDWSRVLPRFETWLQEMIDKPSENPVELVRA